MPHTFQFVDKIDPSRTVRLDLNDLNVWTLLHEGTEFTPPPIRRAEVSTMLTDGERYPSSAYGNRELQLNLMVGTLSADLVAEQVQKLQRELDRPTNILEWKPASATNPVFFRTFRSPPDSIREWRGDDGRKGITVNVMAEPFAYGLREILPAVTVNNDPAASNGMFLDVTGVKGDVETPAWLEYGSVTQAFAKTLIAVRRRGTASNMPFLLQAESMTAGTDTSIQANDVAFSGAGSNWMRCTFATTTGMAKRLEITNWPATASSVDYRGTYRVFARVRRNDATETAMKLQLKWGVTGGTLLEGDITSSWELFAAVNLALVDIGLIQFPSTEDPVHMGPSGTEVSVLRMTRIELHAQRVSGTANLDIDYLLFVPADDTLLLHSHPTGATNTTRVDSYNEVVYNYSDVSAGMGGSLPYQVVGRFPMLSPGVTNRLVFGRTVGAGPDTVTDTTSVTVSYWPRYVYVKPAVE